MCRSRRELSNAYLLTKVGFDTAENEPCKVCRGEAGAAGAAAARRKRAHARVHLGDLYTESGQTLQGSFSSISKPIFASKYSLESSRRDLHNTLLCTAFQSQIFFKNFVEILRNFARFSLNFAEKIANFHEISPEFHRTARCET